MGEVAIINGYSDILSVKDVQDILGISSTTAYKLIQEGEIRSIKLGRCYKIPKAYLQEDILRKVHFIDKESNL